MLPAATVIGFAPTPGSRSVNTAGARQASRIRLDLTDQKVGNVDGWPWVRNRVRRQDVPLDDLGLDVYHLSQNVHEARRGA